MQAIDAYYTVVAKINFHLESSSTACTLNQNIFYIVVYMTYEHNTMIHIENTKCYFLYNKEQDWSNKLSWKFVFFF